MGRGLSDLQRSILSLALANREAEGRHLLSEGIDLSRKEILAGYFRWEPNRPILGTLANGKPRRDYSGHHFSLEAIGVKRYRSAQVAVTRAMGRRISRPRLVHS
jgi:hypothetical protein